jgi:hypothetical protein
VNSDSYVNDILNPFFNQLTAEERQHGYFQQDNSNTLITLTTTLHVSTLLGSSSGVLFFHYICHCNVMFTLCPCVVVPVVGLGVPSVVDHLLIEFKNMLMILALNLVVYALSYLGEYHLWDSYNS